MVTQVRTAPLDVADEDAANAAVQVAVDAFGRLDVVVNNAGYGDIAPFEQLSPERVQGADRHELLWRRLHDPRGAPDHATAKERLSSFRYRPWAVAWPFPAARPTMRPNGRWADSPRLWPRKWRRLASRCVRSNPAACGRTGARARTKTPGACSRSMNRPSVRSIKALQPLWGQEMSDPAKVAQVILRLAASEHLPAHLLMGSDAVQYAGRPRQPCRRGGALAGHQRLDRRQRAGGFTRVAISQSFFPWDLCDVDARFLLLPCPYRRENFCTRTICRRSDGQQST